MKAKMTGIICIGAAAVLAVLSWFLLPDTVVMQVGLDGQPSQTLPKLGAILIPTVLTVAGGVMELRSVGRNRGLVIALVGLLIFILSLVFNG